MNLLSTQMAIFILNAFLSANLENKVADQTVELSPSPHRLKATQSQLIPSEKVASLGQLTAGIAHEIQNPLNFILKVPEINPGRNGDIKEVFDKEHSEEVDTLFEDRKLNLEKMEKDAPPVSEKLQDLKL
ncbi:hypothetical protein BH24BAC1_BH24BAC1_39850 [soil metagenome]